MALLRRRLLVILLLPAGIAALEAVGDHAVLSHPSIGLPDPAGERGAIRQGRIGLESAPGVSPEEMQRLIEFAQAQRPYSTAFVARDPLPRTQPRRDASDEIPATAPARVLRDLLASLERLGPGRAIGLESRRRQSLPLVVADLRLALTLLTAPADRSAMIGRTRVAVDDLEDAVGRGEISRQEADGILTDLAEMARGVTADAIAGARELGLDPRAIARATARLAEGERYQAGRQWALALVAFRDALVGANLAFDMGRFEQGIRTALHNRVVGYAYAINRNGTLHATYGYGLARTTADPPALFHTPTRAQEVASVSKTVTAVAVLQLLAQHGISVDDSVAPYLPTTWMPHLSIQGLTFRHLFDHTSGLNGADYAETGYDQLRQYVEAGVSGPTAHTYENGNFGLLRVLMPGLMGIGPEELAANVNAWLAIDTYTPEMAVADAYAYRVIEHVLKPSGVLEAALGPRGPTPTLMYDFPATQIGWFGPNDGNYYLVSGAFGWYFSARELAAFLAHLRYDDAILPPSTRAQMDAEFLGWLDYADGNGQYGKYYSHGGDWGWGSAQNTGEAHACIMNFPNDVQAAIVINSAKAAGTKKQCIVLRDAYDAAWIEQWQ